MQSTKIQAVSPVRLRPDDRKYVKKLAKEIRESQASVLHRALELLKRERLFLEAREAYFSLPEEELQKIRNENRLFDLSSADGID
jgi:hypothetical protein